MFVQSRLLALYESHICSIFVYGSVATGAAKPPRSDLDLCVILDKDIDDIDKLNMVNIAQQAIELYPIVPKVDFDIASKSEVLLRENITSWGYWLKHHCRYIYGEDLSLQFSLFKPSRAVAYAVNGDYLTVLSDYLLSIEQTNDLKTFLKLSKEASKKLIRSTNILRAQEGGDWPDSLDEHLSRLIKIEPKLVKELMFFMKHIELGIYKKDEFLIQMKNTISFLSAVEKNINEKL